MGMWLEWCFKAFFCTTYRTDHSHRTDRESYIYTFITSTIPNETRVWEELTYISLWCCSRNRCNINFNMTRTIHLICNKKERAIVSLTMQAALANKKIKINSTKKVCSRRRWQGRKNTHTQLKWPNIVERNTNTWRQCFNGKVSVWILKDDW